MTRRVLFLAACAGAVAGFVESLPHRGAGLVGVPIHLTPHYVWILPLLDALLFVVAFAVLEGVGRFVSRLRSRAVRTGVAVGLASLFLLLTVEPLHDLAALFLAVALGVQGGRMAEGRFAGGMRRALPATAAVVVLGTGLQGALLAWGDRTGLSRTVERLPAAEGGAPNILLLILDTVRARSLGLHGGPGDASPALDSLAREGIVFRNAVAPSPWTLPTHASLFTGRWPQELSTGWNRPLDAAHPTVAQILERHGYLTGAFVGNLLQASRHTGLDRGFTTYRDFTLSPGSALFTQSLIRGISLNDGVRRLLARHELLTRKDAGVVNRELFRWVDRWAAPSEHPFFAFLNYFDAHEPLAPPEEMATLREWNDYVHRGGVMYGENAWVEAKETLDAGEVEALEAAYLEGIRKADRGIRELVAGLEARGLLENTVVVIASDHGEQFGENGLFDHSNSLYPVLLHVPLVILGPRGFPGGVEVEEAVSLRDLAPTFLAWGGADPGILPGAPLDPLWNGDGTEWDRQILGHLTRGEVDQPTAPIARGPTPEMHTLVEFPWQYIRNGDGTDEFYHWGVDPDATTNLAGRPELRDTVVALRGRLYRQLTGQLLPDSVPLEPAAVPYRPGAER